MAEDKREPQSAKDILLKNDFITRFSEPQKYISTEHQDYGMRLAHALNDIPHKALYIKLAKEVPRALLKAAESFSLDYPKAINKGKIFMWKLAGVCKENKYKLNLKQAASPSAKALGDKKSKKQKKQSDQIDLFAN